jgi:hypothetical protein
MACPVKLISSFLKQLQFPRPNKLKANLVQDILSTIPQKSKQRIPKNKQKLLLSLTPQVLINLSRY